MTGARNDIINLLEKEILLRPEKIKKELPWSEQTIHKWLDQLTEDNTIKKVDPTKIKDTYYYLKRKETEAHKKIRELDVMNGNIEVELDSEDLPGNGESGYQEYSQILDETKFHRMGWEDKEEYIQDKVAKIRKKCRKRGVNLPPQEEVEEDVRVEINKKENEPY